MSVMLRGRSEVLKNKNNERKISGKHHQLWWLEKRGTHGINAYRKELLKRKRSRKRKVKWRKSLQKGSNINKKKGKKKRDGRQNN